MSMTRRGKVQFNQIVYIADESSDTPSFYLKKCGGVTIYYISA